MSIMRSTMLAYCCTPFIALGGSVKRVVMLSMSLVLGFAGMAVARTNGPTKNPFAAYPPSCLADPLPSTPDSDGPFWSFPVKLAVHQSGSTTASEDVTFYFWRSFCTNGKPALLGRLQRSTANEGRTDVEPLFPVLTMHDHGVDGSPRIAAEPNTVRSSIEPGQPVAQSMTFVFENFPDPSAIVFDYVQDLTISIAGQTPVTAAIPAYSLAQFPDSSNPMAISGYNTGAYYDPAHSGEGMMIEIGESSPTLRYVFVGWFTYGPDGTPYWISGQGNFIARATSVSVPMTYTSGGGFAGNFGRKVNVQNWGTLRIDGLTCNLLGFEFNPVPGLPADVPHTSGSRKWSRLTQINGLNCD